jgi:ATP-dependent helicase/nuclease subunit A
LRSRESASAGEAALGALAAALEAQIGAVLSRASGLSPKPSEFLAAACEALAVMREGGLERFRQFCSDRPTILGRREAPSANSRLQGVPADEMDALLGRVFRITRELCKADDEAIADLVEALAPYASEFRARFLRSGLVDFDGLLALARDLLRDHPPLRDRLKRRVRMLFVDEFQDTDPVQYEIVLFLAERRETSATNAFDAQLEPGKLFIVGDAKQSIYRFRGADYAAYRAAVETIERQGGRRLDLVANFRSVPGIVESVNVVLV